MGKKNADAADYQRDKAGSVDPMGDAYEGGVPRGIRDGRVLDCKAWKVYRLRHYVGVESSTREPVQQRI